MPPDAPAFDSRAWTGPLPGDWPERSDWLPPPRRVEIRHSPSKLSRAVLLHLILLGCLVLTWPRIIDPGVPTILGVLCLSVLALALAIHHSRLWVSAVASGDPLITLEAAGLSWSQAFDGVVPWRDITQVVNRPARAGLILVPPPLSGVFLEVRGTSRNAAAAGSPPWTSARPRLVRLPSSLDRSRRELHDLIQAFRAHHAARGS